MPNHYTTIAICSPGNDFNCDEFNGRHKETCLCSAVRPMPDDIRQAYTSSSNDSWYAWARENWGTKWGTYGLKAFSLDGDFGPVVIQFQSAWGPPKILREIADWLKREGKFEDVVFVGFDPASCSTEMLCETDDKNGCCARCGRYRQGP